MLWVVVEQNNTMYCRLETRDLYIVHNVHFLSSRTVLYSGCPRNRPAVEIKQTMLLSYLSALVQATLHRFLGQANHLDRYIY